MAAYPGMFRHGKRKSEKRRKTRRKIKTRRKRKTRRKIKHNKKKTRKKRGGDKPKSLVDYKVAAKVAAALKESNKDNLTIVSNNPGTESYGLGALINNKQVKRMVSSYVGENKEFSRQYLAGEVELEMCPQGKINHNHNYNHKLNHNDDHNKNHTHNHDHNHNQNYNRNHNLI